MQTLAAFRSGNGKQGSRAEAARMVAKVWETTIKPEVPGLAAAVAELEAAERAAESPWRHVQAAPAFLQEPDTAFEGLARDLVAPGAVTFVAAPRGLGKTQFAHALAVALATGARFRGEFIKPVRVLLVDRDNPRAIVKQRLRAWGALGADHLSVLTREHAPALTEREAWAQFPLHDFDVCIIDPVGSATEGITEKEGKATSEVLATIRDLAGQGLALLLLSNATKDGLAYKGRGDWADRADVVYEVRDATEFTPSGSKPWWEELPPAGDAAWADRAARRKGRTEFHLAFIPSKFCLGPEPEPFCVELRLPKGGFWSLIDVTAELVQAGEASREARAEAKRQQRVTAVNALAELVAHREAAGQPLLKTDARDFLRQEHKLTAREAGELIAAQAGVRWQIETVQGARGSPQLLHPL